MAIENEDQVSVLEGGDGRGAAPKTPEVSALLRAPTTASDIAGKMSGITGIGRRAEAASREMPGVLQQATEAELEATRAETAIKKAGLEQAARAEKEVLKRARGSMEAAEKEIKPYQEFVQPQYKASDYAANAAARLFTGLMLGGVAKISAIGQLQAIRDMQKAEDQGLREEFNAARIKFEEAEKARKDFNADIKERLDRVMKLLPYDRNAALAESKIIESKLLDGAAVASAKRGDTGRVMKFLEADIEGGRKLEQALAQAKIRAESRQPAAGQIFFGTGDKGNQVPILIDPRTAKAKVVELPPGVTGITKPGAGGKVGQNALTFASRVYNNIIGAYANIKNTLELPANAESSILSGFINRDPQTVSGSLSALAGRKITNKEQAAFDKVAIGLGAALARLEAQGLATGGTKANIEAFNSLKPRAGEAAINMALYVALVKQEIENGIKSHKEMNGATPGQKAENEKILEDLNRIIPFEPKDVMNAMRGKKGTISDKVNKLVNITNKPIIDNIKPQFIKRPNGTTVELNPETGKYVEVSNDGS